jgi:hypothetical protein
MLQFLSKHRQKLFALVGSVSPYVSVSININLKMMLLNLLDLKPAVRQQS